MAMSLRPQWTGDDESIARICPAAVYAQGSKSKEGERNNARGQETEAKSEDLSATDLFPLTSRSPSCSFP
jgi:hypothetical protein